MAEHWHVVDGYSAGLGARRVGSPLRRHSQKRRRQAVSRTHLRATHPDELVWTVYTSSDVRRGTGDLDMNPSETLDLFKVLKTPPFVPAEGTRHAALLLHNYSSAQQQHIPTEERQNGTTTSEGRSHFLSHAHSCSVCQRREG